MNAKSILWFVFHTFSMSVPFAATVAVPSVDEKVSASLSYEVKHFASIRVLIYCRKSCAERNLWLKTILGNAYYSLVMLQFPF